MGGACTFKMAAASSGGLLTIIVNFEGNKTVLHLPEKIKVGKAVQKAAEVFKKDPRGLSFLYHGLEITDDMTVGDTLTQESAVIVFHLIRSDRGRIFNTPTVAATANPNGHLYGYCKTCGALVITCEVFKCPAHGCPNPNLFQRWSAEPINHFVEDAYSPEQFKGSCTSCGQENVEARVQFQCTVCDDGTAVCLLRHIRDNIHNLSCMKCGLKKSVVFKFACQAKHTMCLNCFQLMCKQLLDSKKFRIFEEAGFSVSCPGPGEDCQDVPVLDPHHFKIVDEFFYQRFLNQTMGFFLVGDNILCSCKTLVDPQHNVVLVQVKEPEGTTPTVTGLRWYQKFQVATGLKSSTPKPRTRGRVTCNNCGLQYCVNCKQVWHDGNCAPVNEDLEAELLNYPIDPARAASSCWPDKVAADFAVDDHLQVEEDNEKHVDAVKQAMEEKGSLDHTLMQAVFLGPARSGKSSLIDRLTGGEPPSSSPSTGVANEPVHIQVRQSTSIPLSVTDSIWFKLTYGTEACDLVKRISHFFSYNKGAESPSVSQEAHSNLLPNSNDTSTLTVNDRSIPVAENSQAAMIQTSKQVPQLEDKTLSFPDGYKSPLDILRDSICGEDISEYFENSWSLYLTDTGGQMEFQDLLPLLVSGPSVFFITFQLDQDLNQLFTIQYELPDGNKSQPYQTTLTVKEAILQSLASISSMGTFVYKGLQRQEIPIRPKIFLVGTHKDLLDPETAEEQIQKIDQYLQSIITSTSHYHDGLVEFATPNQLIFTVNNLAQEDTDFHKIRLAVEKLVHRGEFKVSSPSHWLILSLVIRYLKSRIISFDECFLVAQQCGVTDRAELKEALHFLHTKLGVVRYFPAEGLDNIVIKDPQVLFDKVTELIVRTFTFDNVGRYSSDEFVKKGIFSLRDFERVSGDSNPLLTPAKLVKLLQHLRIVAPFQTKDGDTKYFIPCVLNHAKEFERSIVSQQLKIPPLVVTFECGYCQKGIPGALIKYLLTNEMQSELEWKLQLDEIFRDQVSIRVGPDFDTVIVKIFPTHIKITCIPNSQSANRICSVQWICDNIRSSVEKGIVKVATDMNYLFCAKHTVTFDCQCHDCSETPQPAEMSWFKGRPVKLQCKKSESSTDIPPECLVWFGQPLQTPSVTNDAPSTPSEGVLNPSHLREVYRLLLPLASEWHNIGILLDISDGALKTIGEDNPQKSTNCLREMLGTWLKQINPHPTWQALADAIEPFDPRLSGMLKICQS